MDSSRTEIEKIIEKIKTIEVTYETLLSKNDVSEKTEVSVSDASSVREDFAVVKKEIQELKQMLYCDKI